MRTVTVERVALGVRGYDVCLSQGFSGLGERLSGYSRGVLVSDSTVAPLWADAVVQSVGIPLERVVIPAGEANKTVQTWSGVVDSLHAAGVDRRTPVIALGGGVVGDIAGFAAATALRGLPFVQLPTTLLAMVDSSVGGKTGVNHASGKNRIGAFHQPALVWASLDTLTTLDPKERIAGLGEVLKTALIDGGPLWALIEERAAELAAGDPVVTAQAIRLCVRAKAKIVAEDERESGVRALLNAGHTVGHALEAALGYGTLRHGEAVGIGLVAEARYARAIGLCEQEDLPERLEAHLVALGLPTVAPPATLERLMQAVVMDKKAVGDMVRVPLPVRAGAVTLVDVPTKGLRTLLGELS